MPLIISSIIIWHAYLLIADSRFLGSVYHSYVFYKLNIWNGLTKTILLKDKFYCFKCQCYDKFTSVLTCIQVIYNK